MLNTNGDDEREWERIIVFTAGVAEEGGKVKKGLRFAAAVFDTEESIAAYVDLCSRWDWILGILQLVLGLKQSDLAWCCWIQFQFISDKLIAVAS